MNQAQIHMNKILSILGNSNSGKTTLITKIIPLLKEKGLKVAVIKHCPKGFDVDKKGKDSWKLSQTGVDVVLASKSRLALLKNMEMPEPGSNYDSESDLDFNPQRIVENYLARDEYDLIITEGFNNAGWDRVLIIDKPGEINRFKKGKILAVVSDTDIEDVKGYVRFRKGDINGIANFILSLLKDIPPGQKKPAESQAL